MENTKKPICDVCNDDSAIFRTMNCWYCFRCGKTFPFENGGITTAAPDQANRGPYIVRRSDDGLFEVEEPGGNTAVMGWDDLCPFLAALFDEPFDNPPGG